MCIVQCCSIYFLSRTRSGHSGATTSRTPKDSSSSLTAMTGTRVEQHFRFLTIFRSQGKSRRGTRRADEDARRGRAEGGGEHQDAPPLVQHQPPYSDFRCCWSSPTSRTCRMQWTLPRSLTSWVCTAWGTETGTFRWDWDSTQVSGGHLCLISGHLCHLWRRSLRGARLAEQPAQERRPLSSPSSSRPSLDIDHRIYTRGSSSI